jgi:hypothetical protein
MAGDRPAYRFEGGGKPIVVFADTGERRRDIDAAGAVAVVSRFMRLPEAQLQHAGVIKTADQWTISQRRQMPLHKVVAADPERSELYVSELTGEIVMYTTRASRALAWVSAIPHWLYFAPLRVNDSLWRSTILWTAGVGAVLALLGLVLAFVQFSPSRPFRPGRVFSYNPYAGWMRWHYVTGVLFGVFTLTWALSGYLSLEPYSWASEGGLGGGMREALLGGTLDAAHYPLAPAEAWRKAVGERAVKEIQFVRIQGDPYYVAKGNDNEPLIISSLTLEPRRELFSVESIMTRLGAVNEGVPVAETAVLSSFDAYYYSREKAPLPVLRIKYDDPASTWFYIDLNTSQPLLRYTRRERVNRWVYHGLHSLDFPFWYFRRPAWDIGVIVLCLGGAVSSGIGLFVGWRRTFRAARRMVARRGREASV